MLDGHVPLLGQPPKAPQVVPVIFPAVTYIFGRAPDGGVVLCLGLPGIPGVQVQIPFDRRAFADFVAKARLNVQPEIDVASGN